MRRKHLIKDEYFSLRGRCESSEVCQEHRGQLHVRWVVRVERHMHRARSASDETPFVYQLTSSSSGW